MPLVRRRDFAEIFPGNVLVGVGVGLTLPTPTPTTEITQGELTQ